MRLFKVDTSLCHVRGELMEDTPWLWIFVTPYDVAENYLGASNHFALEAWERMTTGGLKVPRLPGYPYAHAVETPELTCAFITNFGPMEWA